MNHKPIEHSDTIFFLFLPATGEHMLSLRIGFNPYDTYHPDKEIPD